MRSLLASICIAAVLWLAPAHAGDCQPFGQPQIEQLRATGLPVGVLDGDVVGKMVALLRQHVEITIEPTRLVIVFDDETARILLVVDCALCSILAGPAAAVKAMLLEVNGEPA